MKMMINTERGIQHYNDQFTPADTLEAQMYLNYCIENNKIIDMTDLEDERLIADLLICKLVLIERIRRNEQLKKKK